MGRTALQPAALKFYLAINAAALFGAAALMPFLAGAGRLSTLRLFILAAATLLALAFAGIAVLLQTQPARERQLTRSITAYAPRLITPIAVLFSLLWCLAWLPPQRTGDAYYYFIGLHPLILCGLLATGSALILLTFPREPLALEWCRRYFRERPTLVRVAFASLLAFLLVTILTAQFGILRGTEPYWFGAGVPILASQVLATVLIAVIALRLGTWIGTPRISADTLLFFLVWALAAALWASRPVPPSYWFTAPRPPNFELYPFSDAITYDLGSQFALIGQGIFNRMFFDRALYMSFLVYLHLLGGQSYQSLMAVQAALFAVFPAILYLIGRRLHSRTAGLSLAVLVMLRGSTSLDASAWIDTANFKHMLTDFPTAIGVSIFLLLMLKWLDAPREGLNYILWASGVLGLTSLLRPHVLLLIAASAVFVLWQLRREWRRALVATSLAALAFLLAVMPWMMLGPSSGSLLAQYGERMKAVIEQRYPGVISTSEAVPQVTPLPASPSPPSAVSPAPFPLPIATALPAAPALPAASGPRADLGVPFIVDHFLHNLLTSALIFPNSPLLLSARDVVKSGEEFWRPRWSGGMSLTASLMIVLNLLVLAFGIGAAVQRSVVRGLVPMAVLLLYLLANSAARTSGGRYIVPVDWIPIAYSSVAVAELVYATRAFIRGEATSTPALSVVPPQTKRARLPRRGEASDWRRAGLMYALTPLAAIIVLGSLVPLAGVLQPRRYMDNEAAKLIETIGKQVGATSSLDDLDAMMNTPGATVQQGRLLYPLFYRQGDGEPVIHAPYAARGYPRVVSLLIGPGGVFHVILPLARPQPMPHAADAIVVGCRERVGVYNMISALLVAVEIDDSTVAIWRHPSAPASCPLPEPICDDNSNCW